MDNDIDTTKGGGEYRGIGLVGIIWKLCASTMNNRLRFPIIPHESLYSFIQGRGTGTSTLEAKMDQELVGICHETTLQV